MNLFFLFFMLSGFCSLVYQVAWLRLGMAAFGVTSTMIAIVLSVFMAGLSFGSWSGGRIVGRSGCRTAGSQLRFYGSLEGVIGLSGILSAPLLGFGQKLLAGSAGAEWGSGSYYLVSGAVILIVLFPFCACMGATFPVAMAAVRRLYPAHAATSFSYLYLANLLGAVLGCTGTAFLLIELLGFRGSMIVAVTLNLVIAVAAFAVAARLPKHVSTEDPLPGKTAALPGAPGGGMMPYGVLLLTGIVSMALEVIWTRQFTPFLGPVVYTFATILAIFLAANFAGSRYYRLKCGQQLLREGQLLLGVLTAVAGLAAMLPLLAADYRLPLLSGVVGGGLRVLAGIAPFGFLLGFITPWVVDTLASGDPGRAGRAYAVNTIGCILGPLLAGFVLLPAVGERWATLLLALPFFIMSIWLATVKAGPGGAAPPFAARLKLALPLTLLLAVLLPVIARDYEKKFPDAVVRRDHTATVVAAGEGMNRQLLVNGYGMTVLTPITKMMVHLPLAFHAAPPKNGLVLCFGMGTSFRSMVSWNIPSTVVELVPSIPELFAFYHTDAGSVLSAPGARVVVDDARRFLYRTAERFDVIVVDPPPPLEAAASSLLYSREFYGTVYTRLAPGGIFHQWTDTPDPYLRAAIVRSLTAIFPHVRAFNSVEGWGMHLLASNQPLPERNAAGLAATLGRNAVTDMLEWGPFRTPIDQFSAVLAGELSVAQLLAAAPDARGIEDDRPVNEYYLLRRFFR